MTLEEEWDEWKAWQDGRDVDLAWKVVIVAKCLGKPPAVQLEIVQDAFGRGLINRGTMLAILDEPNMATRT